MPKYTLEVMQHLYMSIEIQVDADNETAAEDYFYENETQLLKDIPLTDWSEEVRETYVDKFHTRRTPVDEA